MREWEPQTLELKEHRVQEGSSPGLVQLRWQHRTPEPQLEQTYQLRPPAQKGHLRHVGSQMEVHHQSTSVQYTPPTTTPCPPLVRHPPLQRIESTAVCTGIETEQGPSVQPPMCV